jgi:hypothetical protein
MNDLSQVRSGGRPLFSRSLGVLLLLLSFFCPNPGPAQSVWDGGGTDNNWTTGDNWVSGTAPVSGSTLQVQFDGAVRLTPNVDTAYTVQTITFNNGASAFTVGGSFLTLHGGVTNADDSDQIISNGIILGNNATFATTSTGDLTLGIIGGTTQTMTFNTAAATTITATGQVTSNSSLTKNGAGTLVLGSAGSVGSVTMNAGTIQINNVGALGTATVTFAGDSSLAFGGLFESSVTNSLVINNGVTGTIDINSNGNDFSGVISGAGTLRVANTTGGAFAILELTSTNTHTGGTTIGTGAIVGVAPRLDVASDGNLGAAGGTLSLNNGFLRATSGFTTSRNTSVTLVGGFAAYTGQTLTRGRLLLRRAIRQPQRG